MSEQVLLTEEDIKTARLNYQEQFDALMEELRSLDVNDGEAVRNYRHNRDKLGSFEEFVALAQARKIAKWGEEACMEHTGRVGDMVLYHKRRDCDRCWQTLRQEVGL
jgi:hypothetical protein